MPLIKKWVFYFISFSIFLLLLELCSYTASVFLLKRGIFYTPLKISPDEYSKYLDKRDELLGWPSPGDFKTSYEYPYDKSGSRFTPAYPDPDKYPSCLSLYGDSFTYGGGRRHEEVWGNFLSQLLKCRVANYGVGGYGTDQAYLRFRKNIDDKSQIVILGISPENILRNVNQYRMLLYRHELQKFALKPRFIINSDGELELIPLPKIGYEEFLQTVNFPESNLKYEYFLPGGKSGILKLKFPCTLSLVKALLRNFHIKAEIRGIPWYKEFYEMGHPSNGLMVTFSIINEFYIDAKRLHKRPVILIIPTGLDLVYYNKSKKWTYENLVSLLKKNKIEFIDAGPKIIEYLKNRNPCELFYICKAHYNPEGERLLAEIVFAYLKEKGLSFENRADRE